MKALIIALGRFLLRLRYRIDVRGLEAVAAKGTQSILFLPNHPSLLDPVIVNTELFKVFRPRALGDKDRVTGPLVAPLARWFDVIPMRDVGAYGAAAREDVEQAMAACGAVLKAGGNLVLYPGGHLQSRQLEELGGNSAVATLLEAAPATRVVLVRTRGLWGSRFSRAGGQKPHLIAGLRKGVLETLANLVFFAPRRSVTVEFMEPESFPRGEDRLAQNRLIESFFNAEAPPALYVPTLWWERGGTRVIPEPTALRRTAQLEDIPEPIRQAVWHQVQELCGVAQASPDSRLARDLGMDSLGRLELASWLETEFHADLPNPESLETVLDVMTVAAGLGAATEAPLQPVDPRWFEDGTLPLAPPQGDTVLAAVVHRAVLEPHKLAMADQIAGVRSYQDLLTAICVLRPSLENLEGTYVGIMLPASVGATVLYLAVLAAGKVPVMINWTVGVRSLQHGVDLLDVRHVLTAQALIKRLDAQGLDLGTVREKLVLLEDLRGRIGLLQKVAGALRAKLAPTSLLKRTLPETAVVLFTSGSESLPKAVPLSHANILANLTDILSAWSWFPSDRMLGCLPPFHSFGLTGTLALPLVAGMPVFYHPNPTEGPMLARMMEAYRGSVLLGTPTFLSGAARAATQAQLATLRLVVTGAEKCPESLYDLMARRWPQVKVLEGYGITECGPVVSGNRDTHPRRGTIGPPLPSVRIRIVHPDTLEPLPQGAQGLLLVRGPSIFGGYLHHDGPSPFEMLDGQAWYRTGDLVREEADGTLVFMGRLKRFMKLAGEMVSLPAIEEVLLAAFTRPEDEEIPLALEATPVEQNPELVLFATRSITREEANQAIREAGMSPLHFVKQVRTIERIPVLGTGKTDYRSLKALLG